MIANPDLTLYALYRDPAGGYTSRPVIAIDADDTALVYAPNGALVDPDYYPDFDRIESVELI